MRALLVLLAVVSVAFGQSNLNWKGMDTAAITAFRADTMRISKAFLLSNAENKLLIVVADDTAAAGRASDSIKFAVGYQLGAPVVTLAGVSDTVWTDGIPMDTFFVTSANLYDPSKITAWNWTLDSNDVVYRHHSRIDTTVGTTSSAIYIPFSPYWSPLIRFCVKGITGNKLASYIKAKFIFEQRAYSYVRQM